MNLEKNRSLGVEHIQTLLRRDNGDRSGEERVPFRCVSSAANDIIIFCYIEI